MFALQKKHRRNNWTQQKNSHLPAENTAKTAAENTAQVGKRHGGFLGLHTLAAEHKNSVVTRLPSTEEGVDLDAVNHITTPSIRSLAEENLSQNVRGSSNAYINEPYNDEPPRTMMDNTLESYDIGKPMATAEPHNRTHESRYVQQDLRRPADLTPKVLSRLGVGRSRSLKNPEDWENRVEVCETKLEMCEAKLSASNKEISKLSIQRDSLEQKIAALKASNSKEVAKWKEKEAKARGDMDQSKRQHNRIVHEHQESHRHEMHRIRAEYEEAVHKAVETARVEVLAAEKKHRDLLQQKETIFAAERAEWNQRMQREKEQSEKRLAELQQRNDTKMSAMEEDVDAQTRSFKMEHIQLTRELAKLKTELSQAQSGDKEELRKAADAARMDGEAEKRKHQETMQKMENAFANERLEWKRQIRAVQEENNSRVAEVERRHDDDRAAFRKHMDEKSLSFEKERGRMRSEFAAQAQDLHRKNESLTGALLKRDQFKGLADFALCSKFSNLSVKLEMISFKAHWDITRENTWPFPENSLNRLRANGADKSNVRKVKQQIIQNSLWFILYHFVFSTPFRILGQNGKDLDEKWFREFGGTLAADEASEWPPATQESEKKRHEVAKSCLEAIQNARRGPDENGYRQQYLVAVQRIVEHIRQLVERVATVDSKDEQKFKELIDDSAKLWLEACCQRYRFRLILPPGAEDVVLRAINDPRAMNLIVKPSLIRYGTSDGQDLTKEEFLNDWTGRVIEYEYLEPSEKVFSSWQPSLNPVVG